MVNRENRAARRLKSGLGFPTNDKLWPQNLLRQRWQALASTSGHPSFLVAAGYRCAQTEMTGLVWTLLAHQTEQEGVMDNDTHLPSSCTRATPPNLSFTAWSVRTVWRLHHFWCFYFSTWSSVTTCQPWVVLSKNNLYLEKSLMGPETLQEGRIVRALLTSAVCPSLGSDEWFSNSSCWFDLGQPCISNLVCLSLE